MGSSLTIIAKKNDNIYIIFRFMNDIRYFGKEKVLCSIQDVSITIQDLDENFLKIVLY